LLGEARWCVRVGRMGVRGTDGHMRDDAGLAIHTHTRTHTHTHTHRRERCTDARRARTKTGCGGSDGVRCSGIGAAEGAGGGEIRGMAACAGGLGSLMLSECSLAMGSAPRRLGYATCCEAACERAGAIGIDQVEASGGWNGGALGAVTDLNSGAEELAVDVERADTEW